MDARLSVVSDEGFAVRRVIRRSPFPRYPVGSGISMTSPPDREPAPEQRTYGPGSRRSLGGQADPDRVHIRYQRGSGSPGVLGVPGGR